MAFPTIDLENRSPREWKQSAASIAMVVRQLPMNRIEANETIEAELEMLR